MNVMNRERKNLMRNKYNWNSNKIWFVKKMRMHMKFCMFPKNSQVLCDECFSLMNLRMNDRMNGLNARTMAWYVSTFIEPFFSLLPSWINKNRNCEPKWRWKFSELKKERKKYNVNLAIFIINLRRIIVFRFSGVIWFNSPSSQFKSSIPLDSIHGTYHSHCQMKIDTFFFKREKNTNRIQILPPFENTHSKNINK